MVRVDDVELVPGAVDQVSLDAAAELARHVHEDVELEVEQREPAEALVLGGDVVRLVVLEGADGHLEGVVLVGFDLGAPLGELLGRGAELAEPLDEVLAHREGHDVDGPGPGVAVLVEDLDELFAEDADAAAVLCQLLLCGAGILAVLIVLHR